MAEPNEPEAPEDDDSDDEPELDIEEIFRVGAITAQQVISLLLAEIKGLGGVPTDLHLILTDKALREAIAQAIIKSRIEKQPHKELPLTVNYEVPLGELIARGKFNEVDTAIPGARFRADKIPAKAMNLIAMTISPNEPATLNEVLSEIKRRGFRAADAPTTVTFATKYPELQLKHPILGLGSIGHDPESGRAIALCATTDSEQAESRILMAEEVDENIEPNYYILIVRNAEDSEFQEA